MTIYVNSSAEFEQFQRFIHTHFVVGFDTETSIAELATERVLHLLQFGTFEEQYLFNWGKIPDQWRKTLVEVLQSERWVKVVHNAQFDGGMLYVNGVDMQRVHDTMQCEMLLHGGMSEEYVSLVELVWKYCRVMLVKDEQTSFGDIDMDLTPDQVRYAGQDVKYLVPCYRMQFLELHAQDLEWTAALENDAALAYGEMSDEGIALDVPYWVGLQESALPIVEAARRKMDDWLRNDPQLNKAWGHLICSKDEAELPLNYPKGLLELMQLRWPTLTGTSKAVLGRFLRDHNQHLPQEEALALQAMAAGDKSELERFLIRHYRDYLLDRGYIIPQGTVRVNWNSVPQVLPIAQTLVPKLKALDEKNRNRHPHAFLLDLSDYKDALKLVSTYGEEFVRKHVKADGKIHTTYNQIVSTGRISSRAPNLQNIPAKESVGNRYRNAFIPPEGWLMVDSDYASQELVIIAELSDEKVWKKALAEGRDLHSVCADLVFKWKWKQAAEPGCAYYQDGAQQKCKCKGHKRLRDQVKTINFGLAYGMTEFELSARLRITLQEARELIREYFRTFPSIKRVLDFFGSFGVTQGYIMTPAPFFRKRWFPYWYENRDYIEPFLAGVVNNSHLGDIQRASMNTPIQGGAADMIKTAMVHIRNYLIDHRLRDKVKLVLQVHDQNTTVAHPTVAEFWKEKLTFLMEDAALLIVRSGLLKAETNITERWQK